MTIGYGHVIRSYEDFTGKKLTEQEATDIMNRDLKPKVNNILAKVNRPLKQNELDALASLVYNIGSGAFNSSTVLRRINNGETKERIAEAWKWWNKGTVQGIKVTLNGLVKRRKEEVAIFNEGSSGVIGSYGDPKKKSY
jgi:lysozyme